MPEGELFKTSKSFIMDLQNEIEQQPSSIWFFLSGNEREIIDLVRLTPSDNRKIVTTGILSLTVGLMNALIIGLNIEKYVNYPLISIILGVITFAFLIHFHRIFFIYSQKKAKSKGVIAGFYILLYAFICFVLEPRLFLYFFLDSEISKVAKEQSSLQVAESLIKVLNSLNTNQTRSVQNLRFLISSILFLFSLLPITSHLLFTRNQDQKIDSQRDKMLQQLQEKLLAKKIEYANLTPVDQDPNDPFMDTTSEEMLNQRKEQLLAEILHIQRSINVL